MALTIEDGSGVVGAVAYVAPAEARAYASARGIALPAVPAAPAVDPVEAMILDAMLYVEDQPYPGERTYSIAVNELAWPRVGAYLFGELIDEGSVPARLKAAVCQLVCEANSAALLPNGDGKEIASVKVEGAVEVQYATTGDTAPQPTFPKVDKILFPLLRSDAFEITVTRA